MRPVKLQGENIGQNSALPDQVCSIRLAGVKNDESRARRA